MRPPAESGIEHGQALRPDQPARASGPGSKYRPTLVDPYREHLRRRRQLDPAVPVRRLFAEIQQLGYSGSLHLLHRYITQGRVESDRPVISPRRLARYLLTRPGNLTEHQRERREAAVAACQEMTALAGLVDGFAALLTPAPGNDERLASWINQARTEDLPHLHAFTRGLELDRHAVNAALTQPFHNGRTEGVNTTTK